MNKTPLQVLLIEDDEDDFLLTRGLLEEITIFRCEIEWAATYSAGKEKFEDDRFDVCLIDYCLGERTGIELLREAVAAGFRAPMILLTGQESHSIDLEAMDSGAADYLVKGKTDAPMLERAIRYALEHKRAETALEEAATRERAIIENALDIICAFDAGGRFVSVNPACFKMLGYRPEELVGRLYSELVAPEDLPKTNDVAQRILFGETVDNFENRYRHKNGTFVNLVWTSFWSESERLMFAVAHDITERKRAEELLIRQRDFTSIITNSTAEGIYALDRDGSVMFINPAAERILGWSEAELLGKNIHDAIHYQCADGAPVQTDQCPLLRVLENGNPVYLRDDVFIHRDGTMIPVTCTSSPIFSDRAIVGAVFNFHDNIEQKELEDRLKANEAVQRQSAERQSAILNSLPAHICLLDRAGNILEVNNEWEQFATEDGCAGIECGVGCNYVEMCELAAGNGVAGARQTAEVCRAVLAGAASHHEFEYPCLAPGGTDWYKLSVTSLHKESLAGAVVMHINITERKRIEAELEQTRDAALESVRLKSEFLANMSHEIRTPMNGIIGMTGLLLKTKLSERQRNFTRNIESSADALLTIINDILDFSKIEAGQMRFEKIDFDLREAIELPVELLVERAHSKKIHIASLIDRQVPLHLKGDPNRLRQILTNLLGNAVKFTRQGEVVLTVKKEAETKKHFTARFEIRDTGIGISEEGRQQLFQAFIQADGSTTRKYGGTGLGLAISKQLVELMGGEIGVESALGEGSTFWFTARFAKGTAPAFVEKSGGAAASLAGLRLLIVDDNRINREILLKQTASWGMIGVEAESGAQALEIMRASETPFDLAILDLMMPEMNGFELARQIKSEPKLSATHLILLPSYGKRGDGQTARDAGIAAYLQKPVRPSQLYNCLLTVIREADGDQGERQLPRLITQHSLRTTAPPNRRSRAAASRVHILVAEDNAVNREVVLNQLEDLGYAPDIVENGREAVEMLKKQRYDAILMDCQMPEMDGFEATHAIRSLEGGAQNTVVIAMTANALEGDREKCLAAGMNDYLSKPVKTETLRRMLEHWLAAPSSEPFGVFAAETDAPDDSDDFSEDALEILAIVDESVLEGFRMLQQPGKPDLVNKLINLFVEGANRNLSFLKEAAAAADSLTIKKEAHAIKGSAGNIGARQMAALCKELEQKAHLRGEAEDLILRLENGYRQVVRVLDAMRQNNKNNQ